MARILLIEDERIVRTVLCRTLAAAGHEVVQIEEAADARELVSLFAAEVVISDANLYGQDGIAVLHEIRASFPRLPLIAISGSDRDEIRTRLEESGLRDSVWVLVKLFDSRELIATVGAALAD